MIKNTLFAVSILVLSVFAYGAETSVSAAVTPAAGDAVVETAVPVKLSESEIPLTIEAGKKITESGSATSKAMASVVVVLVLAGASFYFVRKYRTSNTINKSNMQIKVLTQHYLGPKRSLAIIHVAGESILLGITDTHISMIKSLSLIDDEVPAEVPNTFGQTLNTKTQAGAAVAEELDEEFSFTGVTDTVSKKIKSMRSFS